MHVLASQRANRVVECTCVIGPYHGTVNVGIALVLDLFEKVKLQTVVPLMPNGKIGEDEVSCISWLDQVGCSSHAHSSQDRKLMAGVVHVIVANGTCKLKTGEQQEACIMCVGDILVAVVNDQPDDRRRIYRTSVRAS